MQTQVTKKIDFTGKDLFVGLSVLCLGLVCCPDGYRSVNWIKPFVAHLIHNHG